MTMKFGDPDGVSQGAVLHVAPSGLAPEVKRIYDSQSAKYQTHKLDKMRGGSADSKQCLHPYASNGGKSTWPIYARKRFACEACTKSRRLYILNDGRQIVILPLIKDMRAEKRATDLGCWVRDETTKMLTGHWR